MIATFSAESLIRRKRFKDTPNLVRYISGKKLPSVKAYKNRWECLFLYLLLFPVILPLWTAIPFLNLLIGTATDPLLYPFQVSRYTQCHFRRRDAIQDRLLYFQSKDGILARPETPSYARIAYSYYSVYLWIFPQNTITVTELYSALHNFSA